MRKTHSSDIFDQLMKIVESNPISLAEYRVELLRIALSLSLKKAREHSGKTQQQIAELLDVQQPWISRIESCNNDHTFESLARYILALGADITLSATFEGGVSVELASSKNDEARKYKAGHLPKFITPIEDTASTKLIIPIEDTAFTGDWADVLRPQDARVKSDHWSFNDYVA